jgi:hypothetical protein
MYSSVGDQDPRLFGYPGSGSVLEMRIRIRTEEQRNWPKNSLSSGFFTYVEMFYDLLPT